MYFSLEIFLYIQLRTKGKVSEVVGLFKQKPEQYEKADIFMRGIVQQRFKYNKKWYNTIQLKAGIESYFTDSATAKELEDAAADQKISVFVTVMVAPDGEARIKEIEYPKIKKERKK